MILDLIDQKPELLAYLRKMSPPLSVSVGGGVCHSNKGYGLLQESKLIYNSSVDILEREEVLV